VKGKLVSPTLECRVRKGQVEVRNLFEFGSTREFQNIKFTIIGVQNPRAARLTTKSFKVNIYEDQAKQFHMFFIEQDITVTMRKANKFLTTQIERKSKQNNMVTDYVF